MLPEQPSAGARVLCCSVCRSLCRAAGTHSDNTLCVRVATTTCVYLGGADPVHDSGAAPCAVQVAGATLCCGRGQPRHREPCASRGHPPHTRAVHWPPCCGFLQWLRDRDGEQADCIPFQLQVLFGLLQLTRRRSITTTVSGRVASARRQARYSLRCPCFLRCSCVWCVRACRT